jgi:flavin reductase (DIM6/NTAB) family NADH-FMN oxidoreductase RutF
MSDDAIKNVLRRMPYGFYAITTKHGEQVNAMVANWITQASFEPRLIVIGLQKTCFSYGLIEKGQVFALNEFLKADADSIKPFTKGRSKNPDKMKDATYTDAPITGCPILENAAAYLECELVAIHETGGDHNLVLGEVVGAGVMKEGNVDDTLTLLDLGWSYAG